MNKAMHSLLSMSKIYTSIIVSEVSMFGTFPLVTSVFVVIVTASDESPRNNDGIAQ